MLFFLLLGGIVLVVLSTVHAQKKRDVLHTIEEHIDSVRSVLVVALQTTSSNDVDPDVNALIKDCQRRDAFDAELGRLNTLTTTELRTLTGLFDACGDYFSVRKKLMVYKIDFLIDAMHTDVEYIAQYADGTKYSALAKLWSDIGAQERHRSELLGEQVTLQGTIIEKLLARDQPSLKTLVERAQDIGQQLQVLQVEIQNLVDREASLWSTVVEQT